MELTILMPCLNEARTLGNCIIQAKAFINQNKLDAEILVADNGSTDESVQIAKTFKARVIHVPQKGYGSALKSGIAAAKGKYVIMGDCDMSYDFSALNPFLTALREGAGLVIGNRFKGGIQKGAMPFLHYYLGVPVLSLMGRIIFKVPVGDFHCGLRAVNKRAFLNLNIRSTGMEFATEMIGAFARSSYSIVEVPTTLKKDGRQTRSHLRTFRDGLRHVMIMLKMTLSR